MKNLYIILLLFVSIICYGQTNKDNKNTNKVSKDVFTGNSNIAILHYDSLYYVTSILQFGKGKETILTNSEILDIDKIVKDCIAKYNAEAEKYYEKYKEKHKDYNVKKI